MRYWRFPLKITAFNLLELLAVAAIVVIIAAFAIPSYMNYVTKSRVNTLWQQAEAAKIEVESQYLKQNTASSLLTADSGTAEYTTPNASFVKCITVQSGVIAVRGNPSNFNGKDIWVAWTPTVSGGDISWTCSYSSDAAPYITDVATACAVNACNQYTSWTSATAMDTETFWYFGTITQDQAATAFADNCQVEATMAACTHCYNFSNTAIEQRYMSFSLTNYTYNYQGVVGGTGWNSYSSWSYPYSYTQVTQSCMDQTRSQSSCATSNPYSADPAC